MDKNEKRINHNKAIAEGLLRIYNLPERASVLLDEIAEALQSKGAEIKTSLREVGAVCKIAQRYGEYEPDQKDSRAIVVIGAIRRIYVRELKNPNSKLGKGITSEGDVLWPGTNRSFGQVLMERIFGHGEILPELPTFEGYARNLINGRLRSPIGDYNHQGLPRVRLPGFSRRQKYKSN